MVAASKHHILSGYRKKLVPGLPAEAIPLVNQRDDLRELDLADPDFPRLNSKIDEAICVSSRKKWANKLADSSFRNIRCHGKILVLHLTSPFCLRKKSKPRPLQSLDIFVNSMPWQSPIKAVRRLG
jgi:hypothetical protein